MTQASESYPLVSIGCAVYNGQETLARALEGVVGQSYQNLEIIICDDCSSDRSPDICQEFADKDSRIRYMRNEKNQGIINNCNQLFRLSTGKYFMWADQDDIRDPSFVSKTVKVLEEDSRAVLCHSYTGVFQENFENQIFYSTIDSTDDVKSLHLRYYRFLRNYKDTTMYGLIRSETLKDTLLWQDDLGSANALLFELLLRGSFRQVNETLYYYAGKGLKNRPQPKDEFPRHNGGRPMPWYYMPFLAQASNQTKGILASPNNIISKIILLIILWIDLVTVISAKLIYRVFKILSLNHVPNILTNICLHLVQDAKDIHYLVSNEELEKSCPRTWVLKNIKNTKNEHR